MTRKYENVQVKRLLESVITGERWFDVSFTESGVVKAHILQEAKGYWPKYLKGEINRQLEQLEPVPFPTIDQLRLLERVCEAIDKAGNLGYSQGEIAKMLNGKDGLRDIFADHFGEVRKGILFYNFNVPDYINAYDGWYVKRNPSWESVLDDRFSMLDSDGELDKEIAELEQIIADIEAG